MNRHELNLAEKVDLIKEKENGLSHRALGEKFNVSIGAVSNILKRKSEYIDDYQSN
jgi:transposase